MEGEKKRRLYTLGGLALALALAVAAFGRAPQASAAGRIPTDPAEVLETVAAKGPADPRSQEIAALRRALAANPENQRAALRLARLDIQLARERSDPRYLGQAEAALRPWWNEEAPAPVLVLRATIEQSLHDFDGALRHLDRALALAPDDVQGWLTRAVILTVQARYAEALASCENVKEASLAYAVCQTQVESLTGKARPAYERLASLAAVGTPEERSWVLSSLGEYAARMGDAAAAERHLRDALAVAPDDAYVRGALADLLVDTGRAKDAASLLRGHENDDGMLLRLAIAEAPDNAEHVKMLADRFDASRARGDVVHRREEARFALLRGERDRALALALANWDVQKEPWDVRVLLASARTRAEAAPALAHLARTNLEEPMIRKLAEALP